MFFYGIIHNKTQAGLNSAQNCIGSVLNQLQWHCTRSSLTMKKM